MRGCASRNAAIGTESSTSSHETDTENNQSLTLQSTIDQNASTSTHDTGNEIGGDYTLDEQSSTSTSESDTENNQSLTVSTTARVSPGKLPFTHSV